VGGDLAGVEIVLLPDRPRLFVGVFLAETEADDR
jgi:hypothetical protein